jgi:hypothetical protein
VLEGSKCLAAVIGLVIVSLILAYVGPSARKESHEVPVQYIAIDWLIWLVLAVELSARFTCYVRLGKPLRTFFDFFRTVDSVTVVVDFLVMVSNSMNLTAGNTKNASSYARMARMFRGMKLMKLAKITRTLRALSTIVSMYNALQAVQQKQKLSPRFVQKQNVLNDLGVTHLVCEVIATGDDAARGGVHPFLEKAIELGVQLLEV